ncbi:MAG: LamG-like jellyroll fold domain-containing protein [Thermoanaerobaculia bacterium]
MIRSFPSPVPGLLAAFFLLGACCACAPEGSSGAAPGDPGRAGDVEVAAGEEAALLGEGFLVWESNRSGGWRLWYRRLDGSGLRRLTGDEPGRQHCCPHVSPDGSRLVYLSRPATGRNEYPEWRADGELRLLELPEGSGAPRERRLAGAARTYGRGNRAAVWRNDRELIHVGGDGRTHLLNVDSGASRALVGEPPEDLGWLVDATLSHATTGLPTFSVYERGDRRVLERSTLSGCEPYFSHDGRWGYWVPGAGGPIDRIDLETREVSTLLGKNDPALGGAKGYLYFPMLSRDGHLLAYGASDGDHSHFEADYDVFVVRTDPETLDVLGPPVRLTVDPATDRYPDVHVEPLPLGRHRGEAPFTVELDVPGGEGEATWTWGDGTRERAARGRHVYREPGAYAVTAEAGERVLRGVVTVEEPERPQDAPGAQSREADGADDATTWPAVREGLVFLWQTGNSPNLVPDPETGADRAFNLEAQGRARLDHDFAMVLSGGSFVAPAEAAARLVRAAQRTNELTLEATLTPAPTPAEAAPEGLRPIVTSSSPNGRRNVTLGQEGRSLVLRLRTGATGPEADRPQVELFELEPGRTDHVVVTYTPGRLRAYRNGEPVQESHAIRDSFAPHWAVRDLVFGAEPGGGGDWAGTLEGVAVYDRVLSPELVRENASLYRSLRERRPEVPRTVVRARLLESSPVPSLREISPYRQALAVQAYEVTGPPESDLAGRRIHVARWVILDGEVHAPGQLRPGAVERLVLEPFDANRQLEGVYLSESLEGSADGELYYAAPER